MPSCMHSFTHLSISIHLFIHPFNYPCMSPLLSLSIIHPPSSHQLILPFIHPAIHPMTHPFICPFQCTPAPIHACSLMHLFLPPPTLSSPFSLSAFHDLVPSVHTYCVGCREACIPQYELVFQKLTGWAVRQTGGSDSFCTHHRGFERTARSAQRASPKGACDERLLDTHSSDHPASETPHRAGPGRKAP